MRMLAAMGIFKEVAKDSFHPTALSNAYVSSSPLSAGIIHVYVFKTYIHMYILSKGSVCNYSITAPRT